jgi:hypothetical protein
MKTLRATVLSVLKVKPHRTGNAPDEQKKDAIIRFWKMRLSYGGSDTIYEVELREPLKSLALKGIAVGLNGFVEFTMFSEPDIAAGDSVEINVYEFGEKILARETQPAKLYRGDSEACAESSDASGR